MATFTNQARLTYTGGSAASNITVGELVEVLTAAKTAVVPNYQRGGTVTYLITLTNTGTTALTNLTVTDDLGGYTFGANTVYPLAYTAGSVRYYQNGALQAAPAVTAGPPLTISGITVPAGGNVTLAYEAAATEFAPLAAESTVVNTATAAGAGLANPVTATETVSPLSAAQLAINKALSPTTVTENGQLTYTFTVQNSGNTAADAAANVVITDTFDPRLSNLTVTLNGTALTAPTQYTYDAATGHLQQRHQVSDLRLYPALRASYLAPGTGFNAFGEVEDDLLFGFSQRGRCRFLAQEDFVQRRVEADRHQQNDLKR